LKKEGQNQARPKRISAETGGPKAKQANIVENFDVNNFEDAKNTLNELCPKTNATRIKEPMTQTLPHRNYIRSNNADSVLKLYPKFRECGFMVFIKHSFLVFNNHYLNILRLTTSSCLCTRRKATSF
jgi:hypothetical protein